MLCVNNSLSVGSLHEMHSSRTLKTEPRAGYRQKAGENTLLASLHRVLEPMAEICYGMRTVNILSQLAYGI